MIYRCCFRFFLYLSVGLFGHSVMAAPKSTHCSDYVSSQMCQKIGQMLMVGFGGREIDAAGNIISDDPNSLHFTPLSTIARDIREYHVGNIILYANPIRSPKTGEIIRRRNVRDPAQLAELNIALKRYSDKIRHRSGAIALPLFIAIDQEGGLINRLPVYHGFDLPNITPQALGEKERMAGKNKIRTKKALDETYQQALKTATVLANANIDIDLAPVVDINLNPTNPIIGALGRSYSSDPVIVTNQAMQIVNAFHQKHIIASLKHFPGHGSSNNDSHLRFTDVTDTYQRALELKPYQDMIQFGYHDMIMTTHVVNGKIDRTQCKKGDKNNRETWCPGAMSKKTLTELLRKKLGFQGVLVSDDMTMNAIATEFSLPVALEKALNAGVDMLILANHDHDRTPEVVLAIAKLVQQGKVSSARIEEAYQRIVKLKLRKQTAKLYHQLAIAEKAKANANAVK